MLLSFPLKFHKMNAILYASLYERLDKQTFTFLKWEIIFWIFVCHTHKTLTCYKNPNIFFAKMKFSFYTFTFIFLLRANEELSKGL